MILQALCNYYARMIRDPSNCMPQPGFSAEKISFALSLKPDGTLARVIDLREASGSKYNPRIMLVPAVVKRAGKNFIPNFLWDKTEYVLGVDGKGKTENTQKTFKAFCELHTSAAKENQHPMLRAVSAFLNSWNPHDLDTLNAVIQEDLIGKNCVFMWDDTGEYIHEQPDIARPAQEASSEAAAWCLVSGRHSTVARVHPSIKGVWGGQSGGASIVSFNLDAFTSYGKDQSFNAPVSEAATAAYTSALNYLLTRDHKRCLQVGDASTVFWAEKPTPGEDLLYSLLTGNLGANAAKEAEENSEQNGAEAVEPTHKPKAKAAPALEAESKQERKVADQVHALLDTLLAGQSITEALPDINPDVRFFILALAPNAARISVRFFHVSSFGELAHNAARHQADIGIERQFESDRKYPSLWELLVQTAVRGKTENISSPLAAGLAQAVLTGSRYPQALLMATIGRIRADKQVNYLRAAILKGCLTRNYHLEVPFMLDQTRQDVPYLLGRLFALLEKAQQDALGGINASIRDRFIGSASATPKIVFPQLLRLAQHHIAKSEYGGIIERRIQEVMQGLSAFPAHLRLEEQGTFFIGYYQQRNANYQKSTTEKE